MAQDANGFELAETPSVDDNGFELAEIAPSPLTDEQLSRIKVPIRFLPGGMNEPGTREEKLAEVPAVYGAVLSAPGAAIEAALPKRVSELAFSPLVNPKTSASDLAFRRAHPIIGGVEAGVVDLAKAFMSPVGLATLPLGALPKTAQRAVSLAFATQMAASMPQLATQIGETWQLPDSPERTQKLAELFTTAAGTGAFTALATKHGLTRTPAENLAAGIKEAPLENVPSPDVAARAALALPPRVQPSEVPADLLRTKELVDRAIQETTQKVVAPGQTPAIELLKAMGLEITPGTTAKLAERVTEPGETFPRVNIEGVQIEPKVLRSASDILAERDAAQRERTQNAETIRANQGQLPPPGQVIEGGQAPGRYDVERTASEQPQPVVAREGTVRRGGNGPADEAAAQITSPEIQRAAEAAGEITPSRVEQPPPSPVIERTPTGFQVKGDPIGLDFRSEAAAIDASKLPLAERWTAHHQQFEVPTGQVSERIVRAKLVNNQPLTQAEQDFVDATKSKAGDGTPKPPPSPSPTPTEGKIDTPLFGGLFKVTEPAVPEGMIRLYRGEPGKPPTWSAEIGKVVAPEELRGRWFTPDKNYALYYASDANGKFPEGSRLAYVDVPSNTDLAQWRPKGTLGKNEVPGKELILPEDVSKQVKYSKIEPTPPAEAKGAGKAEVGPVEFVGTKFSKYSNALVSKDPTSGKWRLTWFNEFSGTGEITPFGHKEYASRKAALAAAKRLNYVEATTAKSTPPPSELPSVGTVDKAIKSIEDLQKRIRGTGENLGMNVPVALLDTALEVARLTLKAGKTVAEAIDAAIEHIRKNASFEVKKSFDEAATRKQLMASITPTTAAAPPQFTAKGTTKPVTPETGETLEDVYQIFEPPKKKPTKPGEVVANTIESVRTGLASRFRPIDKLAEDIADAYGVKTPKGIAGIFEQLKGSSGKGEADVYRFDQEVSKPLRGQKKDFNAFMFLRRSLDRLLQDQSDINTALAGGEVKTLNRRQVSDYTIPQLESKLAKLESELGPERVALFKKAAEAYQRHMDEALRLQVSSGRMSPEIYQAIKDGNQFYAPFKVMKYLQQSSLPEGSGRRVDTLAQFTKAMEGIHDKDFRLGDMLAAARQNILLSRILAEKNRAMLNLSKLAAFDADGKFIRKLKPMQNVPPDMETVNVLEGGKKAQYVVNKDVAQALQIYGLNSQNFAIKALAAFAIPFRAGATFLNIPFQGVNLLLADLPRAALISKYGIRGATDIIRYPLDFVHSMYSSITGDMFGKKNKLFLDFLDSGVAGGTVQETLTPKSLNPKPYSRAQAVAYKVLWAVPDFAKAIEQTNKVLGVKRAMRFEGVQSGKELAAQIPEAITELRRFSGSPDFGRQGKWVEQARLNILYMFFNARLQGATADIGRLIGRDGQGVAAKTWGKLGVAVGTPTVLLYLLNQQYADDYDQISKHDKQNYWHIPKDTFITGPNGEKIRDYWRVPKRESAKWIANMTESALEFAKQRDPVHFQNFAVGMLEDISPVNIQGENFQERMESTAASLNPLIKAPLEMASNRDLYRHRPIVPDVMLKASPENQYTDRTAGVFKSTAEALPKFVFDPLRSPLQLEHLTRNLTAGLLMQFLPRKPVEGRTGIENNPLLQRFQRTPLIDSEAFNRQMDELQRASSDEMLARDRTVKAIMDANKGKDLDELADIAIAKYGDDPKLIRHLVDVKLAVDRGITGEERQLLALPVRQRAEYIFSKIKGKDPVVQDQILEGFEEKRILTEAVDAELETMMEKP